MLQKQVSEQLISQLVILFACLIVNLSGANVRM